MQHVVRLHGQPDNLVSDRDRLFTSQFWDKVTSLWGTQLRMSTAYHPQSDGQTERMNRLLQDYLRHYVSPFHDDWEDYLCMAEFAINNAKNESTGDTPFKMVY